MSDSMFHSFAYDHNNNPMGTRRHKRCSYCFTRGNLSILSQGIFICGKCQSVINDSSEMDTGQLQSLYLFVKTQLSVFDLRSLLDFLKFLVYGPKQGILLQISRDLSVRGNLDEYYLDYLRSRIDRLLQIRQGLGEFTSRSILFKYLQITPVEIFYVLSHILHFRFFSKDTMEAAKSMFSTFGITSPEKMGDVFMELAQLLSDI